MPPKYPDDMSSYTLEELRALRTELVREQQQAEERVIMAGLDPEELQNALERGKVLERLERVETIKSQQQSEEEQPQQHPQKQ